MIQSWDVVCDAGQVQAVSEAPGPPCLGERWGPSSVGPHVQDKWPSPSSLPLAPKMDSLTPYFDYIFVGGDIYSYRYRYLVVNNITVQKYEI